MERKEREKRERERERERDGDDGDDDDERYERCCSGSGAGRKRVHRVGDNAFACAPPEDKREGDHEREERWTTFRFLFPSLENGKRPLFPESSGREVG